MSNLKLTKIHYTQNYRVASPEGGYRYNGKNLDMLQTFESHHIFLFRLEGSFDASNSDFGYSYIVYGLFLGFEKPVNA